MAIMLCGFARNNVEGANFAPKTAITAMWIKTAAEKHLKISVEPLITDWRITDIKTPRDKTLPEAFDKYKVTGARWDSKGKTRILNFVFYKNDRIIKRFNVTCKLEFFADVLVAQTDIRRGEALKGNMLAKANRRLEFPLNAYYTEITHIRGQMAIRKIKAGRALLKSEIAETPDVKSGEIVLIVAENKRVTATAKGVAKKNGKIGEMIPVINLRSNKKIYARVTSVGKVEVVF